MIVTLAQPIPDNTLILHQGVDPGWDRYVFAYLTPTRYAIRTLRQGLMPEGGRAENAWGFVHFFNRELRLPYRGNQLAFAACTPYGAIRAAINEGREVHAFTDAFTFLHWVSQELCRNVQDQHQRDNF